MYAKSAMRSLRRIIPESRPVSSVPNWFGFQLSLSKRSSRVFCTRFPALLPENADADGDLGQHPDHDIPVAMPTHHYRLSCLGHQVKGVELRRDQASYRGDPG